MMGLHRLLFLVLPAVALAAVEEITSEPAFKKVLSENVAVVVDFYSQTCGPCIMMAPKYKEVPLTPVTLHMRRAVHSELLQEVNLLLF